MPSIGNCLAALAVVASLCPIATAQPYPSKPIRKGAAAALNDLPGGRIDMAFSDPLVTMPHIQSGRGRALALSGAQRLESAPDIPTIAEAGVGGHAVTGWLGIVVPSGTPADRIAKHTAD